VKREVAPTKDMKGGEVDAPVEIRILGPSDTALLLSCSVFDNPALPALTVEFVVDPRHHIAAAIEGGAVVGFVSAVHYVHPDKPSELWINEVGVAESHRGRGIAKQLLVAMFEHAGKLGCSEAWVLTEEDNPVAQRLYSSVGGTDRKVVYFTFPITREDLP
jgi:ribosomal protein S18 acetylase RimI-like enzyme